ncbi:MAG: nucleotide exchange factor GrpE, partial [Pirellulaceae bacterium]
MSNEPSDIDIDQPDQDLQPDESALDAAAASAPAEIESLREQLADAEKQALLHQADMENFRRRKKRETEDLVRYATMPLVTNLLDVVDNLDRALEAAATDQGAGLREGVELVATQLNTALENADCQRIEAVGQPSDPNLHEAIQMQP